MLQLRTGIWKNIWIVFLDFERKLYSVGLGWSVKFPPLFFYKYLDFINNKKEIIKCAELQELSAGGVPET